jgi:DNA polymerase-3 subunit alpha
MAAVETALEYARSVADSGPMESLFGSVDSMSSEPPLPDVPPWSLAEQVRREREVLGVYLSAHPLQEYEPLLRGVAVPLVQLQRWAEQQNGGTVRVAVVVTAVERRRDRQQRPIAFARVEDATGSAEAVFWHDTFTPAEPYLREGELMLLSARVEPREGLPPRLIVASAEPLERGLRRLARGFRLELPISEHSLEVVQQLYTLQQRGAGGCPVLICLCQEGQPLRAYLVPHLGVELSADGYRRLREALGTMPEARVSLWME